jgi:stearoyl-CoA desaturase (delta-9 desaturase)
MTSAGETAPALPTTDADGPWSRQHLISFIGYWLIHASCLLAFWTGVSAGDLALLFSTVVLRLFGITAGYHRYFSHRTFKTGRAFQFALAVLGCSSLQKGPLWWASVHRRHHRFSDQEGDVHSPKQGFWYSHNGWIFDDRWGETDIDGIRDFARYPELVWLNRWHLAPPLALALLCWAIGGFSGLVWGFLISTTVLWHSTYSINSLAHVWGSRRYETDDTSRNNWLLAILTLGEGWHNNHHHYTNSSRLGFYWWEVDVGWYGLRALSALGLVSELRTPPPHIRDRASASGL